MDMDLTVRLIEALVWPATALITLAVLRKPLLDLIPLVRKIKYKELEINFERKLEALEKKTVKPLGRAKTVDAASLTIEATEESTPSSSPRDIILDAWLSLEATAISTVQHFKLIAQRGRVSFWQALKTLQDKGVLSAEDLANINDLRSLRNQATHELGFTISQEEAQRFAQVSRAIVETIAAGAWQKYGGE